MSSSLAANENPTPAGLLMNRRFALCAQVYGFGVKGGWGRRVSGPRLKRPTRDVMPGPPSSQRRTGSVEGLL
jgi:hypothetical protein